MLGVVNEVGAADVLLARARELAAQMARIPPNVALPSRVRERQEEAVILALGSTL
jgi:enoyl-CoA hydratase/carnithine racemase